jgi:2-methylcitrate dehydratase PrpD
MTGDQSHVTNRLAQFVAGSQWEAIPPEVRREGVRGLLNFVGCALGGAQDEAMSIAVKVLTPFFGPPQAIVIGRRERPARSTPLSSMRSAAMSSTTTTRISRR